MQAAGLGGGSADAGAAQSAKPSAVLSAAKAARNLILIGTSLSVLGRAGLWRPIMAGCLVKTPHVVA